MVRPLALTMPIVTVLPRPNGLPMATTYSPTRSASLEPSAATGRSFGGSSSLSTAMSSRSSLPTTLALELAVVGELDLHRVGVVDDVRVGDDVPLRVDEEARAERLLLHDRVAVALAAAGRPGAVPAAALALVEEREEIAEAREPEVAAGHVHLVHRRDVHDRRAAPWPPAWRCPACPGGRAASRRAPASAAIGSCEATRPRRGAGSRCRGQSGEEGERGERDELSQSHGSPYNKPPGEGFPAAHSPARSRRRAPGPAVARRARTSATSVLVGRVDDLAEAGLFLGRRVRSASTAAASVSRSAKAPAGLGRPPASMSTSPPSATSSRSRRFGSAGRPVAPRHASATTRRSPALASHAVRARRAARRAALLLDAACALQRAHERPPHGDDEEQRREDERDDAERDGQPGVDHVVRHPIEEVRRRARGSVRCSIAQKPMSRLNALSAAMARLAPAGVARQRRRAASAALSQAARRRLADSTRGSAAAVFRMAAKR